jgi:hypothetical protein
LKVPIILKLVKPKYHYAAQVPWLHGTINQLFLLPNLLSALLLIGFLVGRTNKKGRTKCYVLRLVIFMARKQVIVKTRD